MSSSTRSAFRPSPVAAAGAALALCFPTVAAGGDWPQFRGPERNGISRERGLALDWGSDGPPMLWRRPAGDGFSGIAVAGGVYYTQMALDDGHEHLVAGALATGVTNWRVALDETYRNQFGDGPRSTPTVADGVVYALSALGTLVAVDAASGEVAWRRDLRRELGAKVPMWGISTSVTVEGDLLLLDVGGRSSIVALDRASGEQRWGALEDLAGYSTPLVTELAGRRQAVFFTGTRVASLAPDTGEVLWSVPWKTRYDVNAAMPVAVGTDRLFVSSGYGHGGAVLRVLDGGDAGLSVEEVWSSREMRNQFSSSIHFDGHLYGFDDRSLRCLDALTGAERWSADGFGHGSILLADGHLIVLGDKGRLTVVEATPARFRRRSSHQVLDGRSWTAPTLSGGLLLLRNERAILALDLRGKGSSKAPADAN